MLTVKQIHNRLKHMNIKAVSQESGVNYNTVRFIAIGKVKNPHYDTVEALSKFFEEREKAV